ncbi:carbon starvation CstA family protein [Enterobacter chuandaensis]|uniref:carbon starvation CstA family protein n=1 Tax=Enterobacter chuandaensis TaxID=2497875 RepID=UPI0020C6FE93|nr:carbon starvation CstA family protein [Enterobacter chuandaensis]
MPTNRYVLFGPPPAAIAGAEGPWSAVLASTRWVTAGYALAAGGRGAGGERWKDFIVLFIAVTFSLGEMIKEEMGVPGTIALFGCFLMHDHHSGGAGADRGESAGRSPWGVFTVCSTVPIALFMEASSCASCAHGALARCRSSVSCCWSPPSTSAA